MSKVATIASLIRAASRSEADFMATSQAVLDDKDHARTAEYFDRLNIPRSVPGENFGAPLGEFVVTPDHIGTFAEERAISDGIQKYMARHERKIKWHATHPSAEGVLNVLLLMRCAMTTTQLRMARTSLLLRRQDELNPVEWASAREIMNRTFLSYRNFLNLFSGMWVDAILMTVPRDELEEHVAGFHELIDGHILSMEEGRERLEERRLELTVLPEGFPPVRPPIYFGGDLMGRGPWRQYWTTIEQRAHHVRENLG